MLPELRETLERPRDMEDRLTREAPERPLETDDRPLDRATELRPRLADELLRATLLRPPVARLRLV